MLRRMRCRWRRRFAFLERQSLLAAMPTATLVNVPADPRLREDASFSVCFDSTSPANTGFGCYVDLILPATGTDGARGQSMIDVFECQFAAADPRARKVRFDNDDAYDVTIYHGFTPCSLDS